jgi:SAM-dependent methyltransferase
MEYEFTRYLAAKRSVDDRALNRHVWRSLVSALPAAAPPRVVEVGTGIGTMVERIVEWGLLTTGQVTAIDAEAVNIAAAERRLAAWAAGRALAVATPAAGRLLLGDPARPLALELEAIDLFAFIDRERGRRAWDLLIAHAFLDLMDIPATLAGLVTLVEPGGLLYLTVNFDGGTILQPEIDPAFDDLIEAFYHRTMDERITAGRPSGDSRSGRHLFGHLRAAGLEVLDAGSSDWVVFAGSAGYPADEAYFLHFIVETMRGALAGQPALPADRFADWITRRHAQIEQGELVYIAHQLDFLARRRQ